MLRHRKARGWRRAAAARWATRSMVLAWRRVCASRVGAAMRCFYGRRWLKIVSDGIAYL